jgi:hypothetical protein
MDRFASVEARRVARAELIAVTETLIAEFAGSVPAGTVIRHLALAREQLLAAGVRAGLAAAAEAMARLRLATLVVPHGVGG